MLLILKQGGKYIKNFLKRRKFPGYKDVPVVKGKLPFIGHGLSFQQDIIKFVRTCRAKYGNVFRIKIFNNDMVVICDRSLVPEYFKLTEKEMSLYTYLKRLYFGKAFSEDPAFFDILIPIVKKAISVNYEEFSKKILDEADKMSERLARKNGSRIHLAEEMSQFVSQTSARCFTNMSIEGEFFEALKAFSHLLNQIVVLTYFMPKWLLYLLFNRKLASYRRTMTQLMVPEIQKYRVDKTKRDSVIFRRAVDYNENGKNLSDEDIGGIIICLMYVSSENTSLGLTAALTDLACNPTYWNRVREESASNIQHYLTTKDASKIFSSPLIKACVMESARLNNHVFSLSRTPISSCTIGNYYVGEVDTVAICGPMLMVHECASDKFESPKQYDPERFLSGRENYNSESVLNWGAGVHLCPGKQFAIYEWMAAITTITTKFERFNLSYDTVEQLDYFSPAVFAERRNLTVEIHKIGALQDQSSESVGENEEIPNEKKEAKIRKIRSSETLASTDSDDSEDSAGKSM